MASRIALFGGSFNPPGMHHQRLAVELARRFDRVLVIPCGPRPDKASAGLVPPVYRAALADLTFEHLDRVEVQLFDLEQPTFTRNHQLQTRFESQGEVWHVVGADLIAGGALGQSAIQRSWEKGTDLWNHARFAVLTRPGHELSPDDFPPHYELIEIDIPGSATEIRESLRRGQSVRDQMTPRALAYLERYGLYRAPIPSSWSKGSLAGMATHLQIDEENPRARRCADELPEGDPLNEADFITTVGGDGAMLQIIREQWRSRRPFFGINAGHLGFLMNSPDTVLNRAFPPEDVIFRQLPMLYLEFTGLNDRVTHAYAFNDAWVERSTSQSAWIEVRINEVTRLSKLVSDGALMATAAGSTAYARSMGAAPLLADTPAWLIVGSNVMEPVHWRNALLSIDAHVEIINLDPEKRPLEAFVDGQSQGPVKSVRARISKAASAELVFHSSHDMADKIANIQFNGTNRA